MQIPSKTLYYIVFQRADTIRRTRLTMFLGKLAYKFNFLYPVSARILSILKAKEVRMRFEQELREEFALIKNHLPAIEAPVIVDIGAGVGGIDIFLSEFYTNQASLYLLDKSQVDYDITPGLSKRHGFYTSFDAAEALLTQNGIKKEHIHFLSPGDELPKANIIISLYSWGFHYPIETYAAKVKACRGATLIMDLWKGRGQEEEFKKWFGPYIVLRDTDGCLRVCCVIS